MVIFYLTNMVPSTGKNLRFFVSYATNLKEATISSQDTRPTKKHVYSTVILIARLRDWSVLIKTSAPSASNSH